MAIGSRSSWGDHGRQVPISESSCEPFPFAGPAIFFGRPAYKNAGKALGEDGSDVEGNPHPSKLQERDKGGEED